MNKLGLKKGISKKVVNFSLSALLAMNLISTKVANAIGNCSTISYSNSILKQKCGDIERLRLMKFRGETSIYALKKDYSHGSLEIRISKIKNSVLISKNSNITRINYQGEDYIIGARHSIDENNTADYIGDDIFIEPEKDFTKDYNFQTFLGKGFKKSSLEIFEQNKVGIIKNLKDKLGKNFDIIGRKNGSLYALSGILTELRITKEGKIQGILYFKPSVLDSLRKVSDGIKGFSGSPVFFKDFNKIIGVLSGEKPNGSLDVLVITFLSSDLDKYLVKNKKPEEKKDFYSGKNYYSF